MNTFVLLLAGLSYLQGESLREKLYPEEARAVDGRLRWFNSQVSVPELGIEAGKPLTGTQAWQLERLFSVRAGAIPGVDPNTIDRQRERLERIFVSGEGAGPTLSLKGYEHRLVARPGGISVVTSEGLTLSTISLDGARGALSTDRALLGAEVGRALARTGIWSPEPIAVIETRPGEAILVQAVHSPIYLSQLEQLSPSELLGLEGQLGAEGFKSWAETLLPARVGFAAGTTGALGIEFDGPLSLFGERASWSSARFGKSSLERVRAELRLAVRRGNVALARRELIEKDWGELVQLAKRNGLLTRSDGASQLMEQILKPLAAGEVDRLIGVTNQLDPNRALATFERYYAKGQSEAPAGIGLDARVLEQISEPTLREFAGALVSREGKRTSTGWVRLLKSKGLATERVSGHIRWPLPMPENRSKRPPIRKSSTQVRPDPASGQVKPKHDGGKAAAGDPTVVSSSPSSPRQKGKIHLLLPQDDAKLGITPLQAAASQLVTGSYDFHRLTLRLGGELQGYDVTNNQTQQWYNLFREIELRGLEIAVQKGARTSDFVEVLTDPNSVCVILGVQGAAESDVVPAQLEFADGNLRPLELDSRMRGKLVSSSLGLILLATISNNDAGMRIGWAFGDALTAHSTFPGNGRFLVRPSSGFEQDRIDILNRILWSRGDRTRLPIRIGATARTTPRRTGAQTWGAFGPVAAARQALDAIQTQLRGDAHPLWELGSLAAAAHGAVSAVAKRMVTLLGKERVKGWIGNVRGIQARLKAIGRK